VAKEQVTPSDKRRDKLNEGDNDNRKEGEDPVEKAMRDVVVMNTMKYPGPFMSAKYRTDTYKTDERPKGSANSNRPGPKRLAESTLRKLEEARANKYQKE